MWRDHEYFYVDFWIVGGMPALMITRADLAGVRRHRPHVGVSNASMARLRRFLDERSGKGAADVIDTPEGWRACSASVPLRAGE